VDPACAECHGHLGVALLAKGRLAEAERECTLAVLLRPDRADHHAFLASVLERQEHADEAARSWATAARLHPHYEVEARRALGVALARHGRFDEAVGELRAAYLRRADTRVTAELIRALNDAAIARARRGRLDLAEQALVEALTIGPDNTLVRENLAAVREARAH
jgi:Flp pilus assembly protein TadD